MSHVATDSDRWNKWQMDHGSWDHGIKIDHIAKQQRFASIRVHRKSYGAGMFFLRFLLLFRSLSFRAGDHGSRISFRWIKGSTKGLAGTSTS